jgi:phosphate transport system permease protein
MSATATTGGSALTLRSRKRTARRLKEAPIYIFLFACAALSIVTTLGIILVLLEVTVEFFGEVSIVEFLTTTRWVPQFGNPSFGVLPLVKGTFLMAFIAILIAVPLGVLAAIYLSEYAPPRVRSIVKPLLEILAGIPTVVYGFFALTFITPDILQVLFGRQVQVFNLLAASIAVAIMILPLVASMSEDALRSVPQALREGAYGLGANSFEVSTRVVVPGALSGIVAAVILAASRAVGETMIVTLAMGLQPNMFVSPFVGMEAMTAYIANTSLGDTGRGTIEYKSIFAVGMVLFLCTLLLNIFAQWVLSKFREEYE